MESNSYVKNQTDQPDGNEIKSARELVIRLIKLQQANPELITPEMLIEHFLEVARINALEKFDSEVKQ